MPAKSEHIRKVAIQGDYGSFHEMAARKYFRNSEIEPVPCNTFAGLFEKTSKGETSCAVMAIENSVAGSLIPNYTLLKDSGLCITGEVYLRIVQKLLALPGEKLEYIKKIYSHPMAILQCQDFLDPLRQKGLEIIESVDTALSAKMISEKKMKGCAALASDLAAGMYGLEIIAKGVESNARNYTRFLVVESPGNREKKSVDKPDKASLCFSLPHKSGSLSQVLSVFAYYGINLTKIQSLPIVGREWEYFFYLDLIYKDHKMYSSSLTAVEPLTDHLYILGEYRSGRMEEGNINR